MANESLFLVAFLTKLCNTLTEYNSYHTNLFLLYKFNSLSDEFKEIITKSTLKNFPTKHMKCYITGITKIISKGDGKY